MLVKIKLHLINQNACFEAFVCLNILDLPVMIVMGFKDYLFDFYIHSAKSNLHSTTDDDSPEKIQPLKNGSDYVKKWQTEIQNH